jgi:hypothetical protein
MVNIFSLYADLSRYRGEKANEMFQEGTLSRSATSENDEYLALKDVEGHVIKDNVVTISSHQIPDLNNGPAADAAAIRGVTLPGIQAYRVFLGAF